MAKWQRVRYLEARATDRTDGFDRVVFPITPELPDGVMPHLSKARLLREILRDLGSGHAPGSTGYDTFLGLIQQQVLQLDLRGWLDVVAPDPDPAAGEPEPEWPTFILAVLDRVPGARAEVDLLGSSVSLSLSSPNGRDHAGLTLMPAERADPRFVWKRTRTTAIGYRGDIALVGPVAAGLLRALQAWEAAVPDAARTLWARDVPCLAGQARGAIAPLD